MSRHLAFAPLALLALMTLAAPAFANPKALFDNAHGETAGNADWQIDDQAPVPSPGQSGIGPGTDPTYWQGAISSYGVALVKRGYTCHTNIGAITYGNSGNTYDLSNYDVFIVPEPNTLFTAAEATAILAFVQNGGGLVAISDHSGSDRNGDGQDSPMIWNALDPAHAFFGVHWGISTDANNNIVQTSTNIAPSASDSITHGPEGVVPALEFHNGTTFTIYPASNPTVRGEVWMTGVAQSSTSSIMAASCQYGSGRVFMIGDSSPVDDGSAVPGNTSIFDGWAAEGSGGDSTIFLNATEWATRRTGIPNDTQPPTVSIKSPVGGEAWKAGSVHSITWTASDNVGVTGVDLYYSVNGGSSYPNSIATNLANSGTYSWTVPNVPGTQTRVLVSAHDAANNAATSASAANFTIDRWAITASAGAGGTITPSGTLLQAQGTSRTFTITPDATYHVADVLVDGASAGPVTTYTFSAITANHTIAASFAQTTYAVTVAVVGGGSVTRTPDQAGYAQGSSVQVAALPGTGWSFSGWSGDTTGAMSTFSVVVTRALSYTATFADTARPDVSVLAPNGGESWTFGTAHDITWSASDNAGVASVALEYSTTGSEGPWLSIASGQPNTGTYNWNVPGPATTQAVVRVTAIDAAANAASDTSDANFTVLDPSTGVDGGPAILSLAWPLPNPSGNVSLIAFSLPGEGRARIQVLDAGGRRIAVLAGTFGAGRHYWSWDGRLTSGSRARAGLYFVRLSTPFGERTQRLVRLD